MTSFSDLNTAIPLRCPFHALAILQVGFAGAMIFCAPSCFRVFDEVICFVLHTTLPFPRAPDLNLITKKRAFDLGSIGTPVSVAPDPVTVSSLSVSCVFSPDQSAVNLVFAPAHDLGPDVQQSVLLGEDDEFSGCLVVEGNTCLFCQAQVAV